MDGISSSEEEGANDRDLTGWIAVIGLFAVAFLFGMQRVHYGIDSTDESMYLVTPLRYALGDIPFRDEFLNPHRMFDIVLWPVFEIWPDITVYQLRLGWWCVQISCAATLCALLGRFAPRWLCALACVATLSVANLIWSPGYHVMGTLLFTLAWSLWLIACLSNRPRTSIGLGALSGLVFYTAAMSYLPLLATQIVPAFVLLSRFRNPSLADGKLTATVAQIATLGVLSLLTVFTFWQFDLIGDWLSAQSTILVTGRYENTFTEKIIDFLRQVAPFLIPSGLVAIGTFGMVAVTRRWAEEEEPNRPGWHAAALCLVYGASILAILFLLGLPDERPRGIPDRVIFKYNSLFRLFSVAMGIWLGAWIATRGVPRDSQTRDSDAWRFVNGMTIAGCLVLATLHGLLSGMAFKVFFVTLPVFVLAIATFYRALRGGMSLNRSSAVPALMSATACMALGIGSYSQLLEKPYGEEHFSELTREFQNPRMSGIWSTPSRVAQLDQTAAWISQHTEKGDLLLVQGTASILYFMTRTRPALDHAWTAGSIPDSVLKASLKNMVVRKRVPRYAVSYWHRPRRLFDGMKNPIGAFVLRNYTEVAKFGNYRVWQARARAVAQ